MFLSQQDLFRLTMQAIHSSIEVSLVLIGLLTYSRTRIQLKGKPVLASFLPLFSQVRTVPWDSPTHIQVGSSIFNSNSVKNKLKRHKQSYACITGCYKCSTLDEDVNHSDLREASKTHKNIKPKVEVGPTRWFSKQRQVPSNLTT